MDGGCPGAVVQGQISRGICQGEADVLPFRGGKRPILHRHAKFREDRTVAEISVFFCDFHDGAAPSWMFEIQIV